MKTKQFMFACMIFLMTTALILTGCSSVSTMLGFPTPTPLPTYTPNPTLTSFPTFTPYPTLTPNPTLTSYPTLTPNPTYTPFPTFTSTPTPTATPQKKILFSEDFSSTSSCFNTSSTANVDKFIQDGKFQMRVKTPKYFTGVPCNLRSFGDFVFELDATQVDGPDNNAYGIVFRFNGNAYYVFVISGDGQYYAEYSDGTNDTTLLPWTQVPDIKQGKQTNHLKVIAIGDRIELYVNGALVGVTRNNQIASGQIGLVAVSFDQANVQIAFDNIKVTEP